MTERLTLTYLCMHGSWEMNANGQQLEHSLVLPFLVIWMKIEGDSGWDGWMASLIQWTWTWAKSRRWWGTGRPGVLQSMGLQRVRHNLVTEQQHTCFCVSKFYLMNEGTCVSLKLFVPAGLWGIRAKKVESFFMDVKCCIQYASKLGKLSSGHRTGKVSFYSNPKERQCQRKLKLLHNCIHLASKVMLKILQARL